MTTEIGYFSDNSRNIHFWDALTADGSTPAVKLAGTNYTFVDKIVGANITTVHEGSLNGIDWFTLEVHSHTGSGIDHHTYSNKPVLYVRTTASSIGAGESFHGSVMCE
jgi:hypothetical protein